MAKDMQCIAVSVFHPVSAGLQQLPLHFNGALCRNKAKSIQLCKLLRFLFSLQQLKARAVSSWTSLRLISSDCYLSPKSTSNCNAIVFSLQIWHCLSCCKIFRELSSQFSTFIFNTGSFAAVFHRCAPLKLYCVIFIYSNILHSPIF